MRKSSSQSIPDSDRSDNFPPRLSTSITFSMMNASIMSPIFRSLKFWMPIPHSYPRVDFRGVILEAFQRSDLAFEDHDVVAQQAEFGVRVILPSVT